METSRILKEENMKTDVVVIGGGGTGLAAAVTAAEKGAKVILLEKKGAPAGNSAMAFGFLAAESPAQKRMSISVTKDDVFKEAMDSFHWQVNPRIWRAFLDKSGDTVQWLENMGLKFNEVPYFHPGQTLRIYHCLNSTAKTGLGVVKILRNRCKELGVQILTNCPVKKILTDKKGVVTGVLAQTKEGKVEVTARSVIIGTGGYGGNKELLNKYSSSYSENMPYVGFPFVTGDGLLMAMDIGAATEGLGTLMLCWHAPTIKPHIDAAAQQPIAVFVNKRGERFIDEAVDGSLRCDLPSNAILRQPDKCAYCLFDEKIKHRIMEEGILTMGLLGQEGIIAGTKLPNLGEEIQLEASKGKAVVIADSWDEIAKWMGADPKVLNETIEEYNSFCDKRYDPVFNKDRRYLCALRNPPYYAIKRYLALITTIGGIKINHHMEVLNDRDNPIPGLYAGGDTTGGWELDWYNKDLSGSALGFALNSGRIAGENATEYAVGK